MRLQASRDRLTTRARPPERGREANEDAHEASDGIADQGTELQASMEPLEARWTRLTRWSR
ncbi:hypothetical protein [Natrinema gelatinilyticum]|uniref:hypothetical protein n=1 Tax=Natrinema gelatinilyticum TaxID=2961571 RepID=UPI0020C533E9|nr:hypothetical protein [Natrinema gelatinilyticum]